MACAKIKKHLLFYLGRKPLSSYKMVKRTHYSVGRKRDTWKLYGSNFLEINHKLRTLNFMKKK